MIEAFVDNVFRTGITAVAEVCYMSKVSTLIPVLFIANSLVPHRGAVVFSTIWVLVILVAMYLLLSGSRASSKIVGKILS